MARPKSDLKITITMFEEGAGDFILNARGCVMYLFCTYERVQSTNGSIQASQYFKLPDSHPNENLSDDSC